MSYRKILGDWGEDVAARLLEAAGFTEITLLNAGQMNHPGGDILATQADRRYLFSVKARDRFMQNGKINWGYNVYPKKVIAAAARYHAEAAWLVVRADRRTNTYCAYWGKIDEIPSSRNNPNRVYISMLDEAISGYRCLAKDVPDNSIARIFQGKLY